jgi:hypothetical protein
MVAMKLAVPGGVLQISAREMKAAMQNLFLHWKECVAA